MVATQPSDPVKCASAPGTGVLQAATESPAVSPTTSPRRVSRRDVDLGLSPAAPNNSPSPNSLPYQASPDHPDLMEEKDMSDGAEEEDEDDEISSGADTPKVSVRSRVLIFGSYLLPYSLSACHLILEAHFGIYW